MTMACPSDLALERLLLGRADLDAVRHAEECPGCSVRLASMRRTGESFRRFVYPPTVERVEAAAERGPRRRFLLALAPASLLAAAAAMVISIRSPPPGYLGVKGGDGIGLSLFAPGSAGPRLLADGVEVSPRTALRFRLRAARACRLFLVSVDGAGAVSRLDGAGADGLLLSPGQHDLPGGVELDAAAGPERFYAICAPEGVATAADVERSARTVGADGPAGVRRAGALGGLPAGASQTTHLLEKRQ
jgi:hypothetical protein